MKTVTNAEGSDSRLSIYLGCPFLFLHLIIKGEPVTSPLIPPHYEMLSALLQKRSLIRD
jgi:hypothetical protein